MKVSWELVNPLCPGFYIYLPVIWSASAIGQRAAQRAVIGRGVSRQVILTPATPDGARSEVSPSTGLAWLLSCIIIIIIITVAGNWLGQLWLTLSTHLSWDCVWYHHTIIITRLQSVPRILNIIVCIDDVSTLVSERYDHGPSLPWSPLYDDQCQMRKLFSYSRHQPCPSLTPDTCIFSQHQMTYIIHV